jgi:FAD/FMN-containing dehydrogenase
VVTAVPESRAAAPEDAVLGSVPAEVFEPESIEEAVAVMRECARERKNIAIVGGGRSRLGRSGLARPSSDAAPRPPCGHAPSDQIVVAEAGLTISALQRVLARLVAAGSRSAFF